MTTSIEFAKAVTESNLQGNTDKNFSHEEIASIQHTNAAIRQAVRQHAVSRAKRINDGDFPYNIYDATGRIVKPEAKKAKKKA